MTLATTRSRLNYYRWYFLYLCTKLYCWLRTFWYAASATPLGLAGLQVTYAYNEKKYRVLVPYRAEKAAGMLSLRATLHLTDGSILDITQQPGVPYLCKASDLGGEKIVLYNAETNNSVEYTVAPGWAEEIVSDDF